MGVSKVEYAGNTLIDLTEDTVTSDSLLSGVTAHTASGERVSGTAVIPTKVSELENDAGFATKKVYTITLASSWSGSAAPYTQSVAVEGILATDNPHITPIYSDTLITAIAEQEAWNCVSKAETAADTITFTCFADKPTIAVSLQIEVNR